MVGDDVNLFDLEGLDRWKLRKQLSKSILLSQINLTFTTYTNINSLKKLKYRGWYSKGYWYFINAATTDNSNNDDNTPASVVTLTATTNNSNNNNNVIIIKIITIKMKSGYALKKINKSSYTHCSPHFLFGETNAPWLCVCKG